jgi:hypothetical protein
MIAKLPAGKDALSKGLQILPELMKLTTETAERVLR